MSMDAVGESHGGRGGADIGMSRLRSTSLEAGRKRRLVVSGGGLVRSSSMATGGAEEAVALP